MESRPVFVLFGPTASGKTELLSRLFLEKTAGRETVAAEVVSADSMQVYRGMDIGTAKPSPKLRRRLPHHLIDIRDPNEQFNVGDFVRLADLSCADIYSRGKLPVVSGGTGFYLKNFILGLSAAPPSDPAVRETLKKELTEKGAEALRKELAENDGESAARIHINDTYRLLRALEVFRLTGLPLSSFVPHGTEHTPPRKFPDDREDPGERAPSGRYRFLIVELSRPREELYRRIERRCDEMFRIGLAGEVEGLFRKGYTPEDPGMRAIGYREFFVDEGAPTGRTWRLSEDPDGVKNLVTRNSRRYAKRQITFFASIPNAIKVSPEGAFDRILDLLSALVHTQ
ncbi:MAG: tRNA (adenosine(37)-N6)-dimethylallyltransferase MiaA [Treponema sp.]|jgi:tRNA dimethylallyltransferase|nr:tRNA (adenosine(37)-N6)-dimethylallyltransferase MiaA [Treponema sp.]